MKILNEQAINEIAPALMALARAAPAAISKFGPAIKKGASSAAKFMKDNPEFATQMADMVMSIKDKVPELANMDLGDANSVSKELSGENGELLLKVLQDASSTVEEEGLADETEAQDVDGVFEGNRKICITKRQLKRIVKEAKTKRNNTVKITERQLKKIIKEEKSRLLKEQHAEANADEFQDIMGNIGELVEEAFELAGRPENARGYWYNGILGRVDPGEYGIGFQGISMTDTLDSLREGAGQDMAEMGYNDAQDGKPPAHPNNEFYMTNYEDGQP